jgi:hypothetical protein
VTDRETKSQLMAAMKVKVMAATTVPSRNNPPTLAQVSVDRSKAWRGSSARGGCEADGATCCGA